MHAAFERVRRKIARLRTDFLFVVGKPFMVSRQLPNHFLKLHKDCATRTSPILKNTRNGFFEILFIKLTLYQDIIFSD